MSTVRMFICLVNNSIHITCCTYQNIINVSIQGVLNVVHSLNEISSGFLVHSQTLCSRHFKLVFQIGEVLVAETEMSVFPEVG